MISTTGRYRRLTTLSTTENVFTILAIDHRDSMRVVLSPEDPAGVPTADIVDLKLDLLQGVGPSASGVMLDPEYGIAPAIHSGILPSQIGFIAALEQQGYLGDPSIEMTSLLPDWGVTKAARSGASGLKLLVLYHPDGGDITDRQDELIRTVIADARAADVPLFLEPLPYSPPGSAPVDSKEFPRFEVTIATARRLSAFGPDILKVQFPVNPIHVADVSRWRDACDELTAVCEVPWALLSGGGDFETFRSQFTVAAEHGASGFMVGRALWSEAVDREARGDVINRLVAPRFTELAVIARSAARPWSKVIDPPETPPDWHQTY
ncbi:MAG: tagatose 1,6-diphosphate aldolase [Acidimicrobiia bacterium]|nr:tagatose 1,6-diphosphate aldolase [Acidimicrobiia bacterium]NNF62664.1 tagatose 1,6-diphosphate aldolase [Acidimicrobiia bacterium]